MNLILIYIININNIKNTILQKERNIMDNYRFGTVDYLVLVGMTLLSTGTGIYFGALKSVSF